MFKKQRLIILILLISVLILASCSENSGIVTVTETQDTSEQGTAKTSGSDSGTLKTPASFPERFSLDLNDDSDAAFEEQRKWMRDLEERAKISVQHDPELDDFYKKTLSETLISEKRENLVVSPLNIYIATAMLTECTEGSTRTELLKVLGAQDISALREQVRDLWNANYEMVEQNTSILSNSIWLNSEFPIKQATLDILSRDYLSDSFYGDPSDPKFSEELRNWMNHATRNLLKEEISTIEMDPEMLIRLVSAIYYKTSWKYNFSENETKTGVFHGASGDREVEMMENRDDYRLSFAAHWKAIALPLIGDDTCYIILPNEVYDLNVLLSEMEDPEHSFLHLLDDEKSKALDTAYGANCKIPKFDIRSKIDLKEYLKKMGAKEVTQISGADFSALSDALGIALSSGEHAARVTVDEKGVTAAAYSTYDMKMTAINTEEREFVVDRPFLFLIVGNDKAILFGGAVWDIE